MISYIFTVVSYILSNVDNSSKLGQISFKFLSQNAETLLRLISIICKIDLPLFLIDLVLLD